MADAKCSVSWCQGKGVMRYRGDRVNKTGQTFHKKGYPVYAHQFYKSYFWICANHNNGNFSPYSEDKNWDKWNKQSSIAREIYQKNWGDY
jgi:hypothetical protein